MKLLAKEIVKKHVNTWDPIDVLTLGAPSDEYEVEIQLITDLFIQESDKVIIAKNIQSIFLQMFDKDFPFKTCLSATEAIWDDIYE